MYRNTIFFLFLRTGLKFTRTVKETTCTEHMETGCSGEHLDSHSSKKQEDEELRNEASIVKVNFHCSGINIDMHNFTIALLCTLV